MNALLLFIPVLAVLIGIPALVLLFHVIAQTKKRTAACYALRPSLLTPAEMAFAQVLTKARPAGSYIAPKVRLADVFDAPRGDRAAFARIAQKHVDFLLIDEESGRPLAGIELDDRSHQRADRRARDEAVNGIFAAAGLPLLHVKARAGYSAPALAETLQATLNVPSA